MSEEHKEKIDQETGGTESNKAVQTPPNFLATLFYVGAVIFVGLGFYKMFVYQKGVFADDSINAYVGGDAFNYIINAIYAGDYFILALLCVFIGAVIQILSTRN